jgi:hypothetical protein
MPRPVLGRRQGEGRAQRAPRALAKPERREIDERPACFLAESMTPRSSSRIRANRIASSQALEDTRTQD